MDSPRDDDDIHLKLPKIRKSFEVMREINQIKSKSVHQSSKFQTSTDTKHCKTLISSKVMNEQSSDHKKNSNFSLGLIDIDNSKGIGDSSDKFNNHDFRPVNKLSELKSISFNFQEISGRSTSNSLKTKDQTNVKCTRTESVNEIIEKSKLQSDTIDNILKSSNHPAVFEIRESLASYRFSLDNRQCDQNVDEFENSHRHETKSALDSFSFTSLSKVNMTQAELSWLKEKGDLPIHQKSSLFNDTETYQNIPPPLLFDNSNNSSATPIFNSSKMSVGNYFSERCNNINDYLCAASPKKRIPHSFLCNALPKDVASETIGNSRILNKPIFNKKEIIHKSTNLRNKLNTVDNKNFTMSDEINTFTDASNTNDTISSNPISLTQIQNILENVSAERPSVIIDNMLGLKKNKKQREKNENKCFESTNRLDFNIEDKQNLKDFDDNSIKSPFLFKPNSETTNMFHSTKNEDSQLNYEKAEFNFKSSTTCKKKLLNDFSCHLISPIKEVKIDSKGNENENLEVNAKCDSYKSTIQCTPIVSMISNSEGLVTQLAPVNEDINSKTNFTKALSQNGTSIITDKMISLNTINDEFNRNYFETNDNLSQEKRSPITEDNVNDTINKTREFFVSPLEVNGNLKDKSFVSNESEKICNSPSREKHVKKLLDQFDNVNISNDSGWISPTRAHINDGKCQVKINNPENIDMQVETKSLNKDDATHASKLCPWIKVCSSDQQIVIGIPCDINFSIKSLSSKLLSVKFSLDEIYIDDQLCPINTKKIVLHIPSEILLKSDSIVDSFIKITSLIISKTIKVKFNMCLKDIITHQTSQITHMLTVESKYPKLSLQTPEIESVDRLEFPSIPEQCSYSMPVILWNESHVDLSIKMDVECKDIGLLSIANVENVAKADVNEIFSLFYKSYKNIQYSEMIKDKVYTLPCKRKSGLLFVLQCFAPKLKSDCKIQEVDAHINILSLSTFHKEIIPIFSLLVSLNFGISTLLIRYSQKTDVMVFDQSSTETVEMFNAGSITMEYKIYVSLFDDKNLEDIVMIPCRSDYFILDKSKIVLKPSEKAFVKISYPTSKTYNIIKGLLVFESLFTTEVIKIIGTPMVKRCTSQQSLCSVESNSTHSQETLIKVSKKELSWGSLKVNEEKLQDIVFKNISLVKKLKLLITANGEGFMIISDNNKVSSLTFILQPQECKTIHILFKPMRIGEHTGTLLITRKHNRLSNKENIDKSKLIYKVPLNGVGGHSVLIFRDGIFRHAGAQGLPLGSLCNSLCSEEPCKEIPFTLWNKGDMPGFVIFNINLKWKYRTLGNEVCIVPNRAVIYPSESLKCVVTMPKRALLLAKEDNVDTDIIGVLTVLHGDESTRVRIKKIYNDAVNIGMCIDTWNSVSQGNFENLCKQFPEENDDFINIAAFRETFVVSKMLFDELQLEDISLMYDFKLDYSTTQLTCDLDETLQFHTICESEDLSDTTLA